MNSLEEQFFARTKRILKKGGVKKYPKLLKEVRAELNKYPQDVREQAIAGFMLFVSAHKEILEPDVFARMFSFLPTAVTRALKRITLTLEPTIDTSKLSHEIIEVYKREFPNTSFSEERLQEIQQQATQMNMHDIDEVQLLTQLKQVLDVLEKMKNTNFSEFEAILNELGMTEEDLTTLKEVFNASELTLDSEVSTSEDRGHSS